MQERCGRDKWKREVEERSGVIGGDQSSSFVRQRMYAIRHRGRSKH